MKTIYKYTLSAVLSLAFSFMLSAGGNNGKNGNNNNNGRNGHWHRKSCKVLARFSYQVNGCTVNFTDKSRVSFGSTITNWYWNFGDGTQDTVQNPTHIY